MNFITTGFLRCVLLLVLMFAVMPRSSKASGATVAVFKDARSGNLDIITNTLNSEGFKTIVVQKKGISDPKALEDVDVIYFPGGWNSYNFLDFEGRKEILDFLACGKGVLAGAFRSGYVRTANYPLVPEVGAARNRVSGNYVFPSGKHPILKGFTIPFCHQNHDHLTMDVGESGEVFLVDSGGEAVGVCGEVFNGRYVAIGLFMGLKNQLELTGVERQLFMNCIRWLADSKALNGAALVKSRHEAEIHFLHRERLLEYTRACRGPGNGPGIVPELMYDIRTPLDSLKYQLQYQAEWLTGENLKVNFAAVAGLDRTLNKLNLNFEKTVSVLNSDIRSMTAEQLLEDDPRLRAPKLKASLQQGLNVQTAITEAMRTVEALQADVDAARVSMLHRERVLDGANVPGLLEKALSTSVVWKRNAVLDLGRIGDERAVLTMIALTEDPDEQVRRNAIQALGWMQAVSAVPALKRLAQSGDKWVRRRAVQALGQVGDSAALDILVKQVKNDDFHTSLNAILSLGWIGEPTGVPCLLEVLTTADAADPDSKEKMCAAIRALAHIGDKTALPVLEKIKSEYKDYPTSKWARHFEKDELAFLNVGLAEYARLAIEEIERGGRKEKGVVQPLYLNSKKSFYGVKRKFNFFGGRPAVVLPWKQFKDNPDALVDYMWSAGATGMIKGWYGMPWKGEKLDSFVRKLGAMDMKWIIDLPISSDTLAHERKVHKAGCERLVFRHKDQPAFAGFWNEESYPIIKSSDREFERFLIDKYGKNFRSALNLPGSLQATCPEGTNPADNRRLAVEYSEFQAGLLVEDWREGQEWLHGLRKACAITFNFSGPSCMSHLIGGCAGAGEVIDAQGPESYNSHGRENTFMMDLARDGEVRPVLCEFYNWYSPSVAHTERGFASQLMHGECFFNFYMGQIFEQAPRDWLWVWEKGRWEAAKRIFLKARKVSDYLAPTASAATVALIYSDRTSQLFYSKGEKDRFPRSRRYFQHQCALWTAMQQSHIPTDSIWAETLTPAKLARYEVAVLSDAKSLTPEQVETIREWVRAGGVLLATGTTSLFNQWGELQEDYLLGDVFGVSYEGHLERKAATDSDTYCFVDGAKNCEKVVGEGLAPSSILYYVHREVKPSKSIELFTVTEASALLPGITNGMEFEYDAALGVDKVKTTKAKTVARWHDALPAVTVNKFGKGSCIFWSEIYPGLCHTDSSWEMHSLYKKFWPGIRELIESMIEGGLSEAGEKISVVALNCPDEVELTVRTQLDRSRWIVHLLNYDTGLETVDGCELVAYPPRTDNIHVFYPDDGSHVRFTVEDKALRFPVRKFGVHEMIVIRFGEAE